MALAGLTGLWLALGAAAQNTNTVYAYDDNYGIVFNTTVVGLPAVAGTPGAINLGAWGGSQAYYGAASGSSLTLRALAAAKGQNTAITTRSSFDWTTTVLAGTSGLSPGDPIKVDLKFRIDGGATAGFGAGISTNDFSLQSSAAALLTLKLYDLDSLDYEPGAPQIGVSFNTNANVQGASYPPSASYPGGAAYTSVAHSVGLQAQTLAGTWNWPGNDTYSTSIQTATPSVHSFDVDTGLLSFSLDTFVGNHLQLQGMLSAVLRCDSYSSSGTAPSCAALSDYSKTFDAELGANVAGVTFSDYVPGVLAVPEPASWALMFVGVAALLHRVRRERQADGGMVVTSPGRT